MRTTKAELELLVEVLAKENDELRAANQQWEAWKNKVMEQLKISETMQDQTDVKLYETMKIIVECDDIERIHLAARWWLSTHADKAKH